ncbi:hypothetical protein Tco_1023738 [Tanacetum coccineum]
MLVRCSFIPIVVALIMMLLSRNKGINTLSVLDRIKSFPRGTSCGRDGLRAQHLLDCLSGAAIAISDELVSSITQVVNLFLEGKCPMLLGEYIASAPLTPLVKPGGGIRPIAVGTIWRRLVSKVSATMIGHSLDGYLDGLQFGVGVPGGGEAIIHAVNRLVEDRRDDVGLSMLLVDFQNAFNMVDRTVMLQEVRLRCPAISRWVELCYSRPARLYYGEHSLWSCQGVQQGDPLGPLLFSLWYLDDGTIVGDTLVVGKVLDLITKDGPRCGLHLNVDKTELFWPKEDPRSRLEGIFPPNISRPLHGVKLLGAPVSVDVDFGSALVMKRSATLQTKLLRDVGIVAPGSTFDDALCVFNNVMEIDFLSNLNGLVANRIWEDHTSDWLRVILISGLGQTMNGKTYRSVLCYRLGVPLFSISKPCSACSRVFVGDIYGDHAVSCAGIIGIKASVTFMRILGMSDLHLVGRETDATNRKTTVKYMLRQAGQHLYNWQSIGFEVSSFSFSPWGELEWFAVTLLKRVWNFFMAQDIGAALTPRLIDLEIESYYTLAKWKSEDLAVSAAGEFEVDSVTLLKRIRKFFMAQDIVHTVKRIFRYLKGQPKLGLWYPRDSPLTWRIFMIVLWIKNQILDYGFNFMNTKIYIDNKSTICNVKNPIFHSKTKHIKIRHHFMRFSYEKKLIQVIKIHTDHNVADLLIKAFDVSRPTNLGKPKGSLRYLSLSGPIHLVANETIYKEWEDRKKRAATTASSLEAEQDSGNINRT